MKLILAIAAGGALGAVSRHYVGKLALHLFGLGFPFGTLAVNVVGSLLMGVLAEWFVLRGGAPVELRGFLTVGFLGALTTFSTFSLDVVFLYERGETALAALYIVLSFVLSVGALFAGLTLTRSLMQ